MFSTDKILKQLIILLFIITNIFVFGFAIPTSAKKNLRINKKQLSDEEHYQNLDNEGLNEFHNRDFDHEAFLGSDDEADEFDQLTPVESKARLAKIITKIDINFDDNVTETELRNWIYQSQKRYIFEDVDRQWLVHTDNNYSITKLSWEQFRNKTYGFLDKLPDSKSDDMKTYHDMLRRDERRWIKADANGDKTLDREEFISFLHPEESQSMYDVVVDETLEDIDHDHDGKISESEYISDMYSPEDGQSSQSAVPEWVNREREQFHNYRDRNKDGYLDREEIKEWILPANYDHAEAEAKHLIYEADANKDGVLSRDEILDNYDVFVGSQATDFGEALTKHDEF